jgi:hypothetical protein
MGVKAPLEVTVKRGDQTVKTTVLLREILQAPASTTSRPSRPK